MAADLGWVERFGLSPAALPGLAGRFSGPLVVCGDGVCVWDDLERLGCARTGGMGCLAGGVEYMAVNALGMFLPGVLRHWYSNDARWLAGLVRCRRPEIVQTFGGVEFVHTWSAPQPGQHSWPWPGTGTSSLNAALVGVAMGYSPVILCGVPLDDGPNNGMPPWRRRNFLREVPETAAGGGNRQWRNAIEAVLGGRCFSMSGRTREWLGEPPMRFHDARSMA